MTRRNAPYRVALAFVSSALISSLSAVVYHCPQPNQIQVGAWDPENRAYTLRAESNGVEYTGIKDTPHAPNPHQFVLGTMILGGEGLICTYFQMDNPDSLTLTTRMALHNCSLWVDNQRLHTHRSRCSEVGPDGRRVDHPCYVECEDPNYNRPAHEGGLSN